MKFSWKNIKNWRSWKMMFFWGGHFEFSKSAILNFFLLHLCEKSSPFIWGIIFFCTMDGFSRILEKRLSQLICTRLYMTHVYVMIGPFIWYRQCNDSFDWIVIFSKKYIFWPSLQISKSQLFFPIWIIIDQMYYIWGKS